MVRCYWTKEQEDRLCIEVAETHDLLKQITAQGKQQTEYWAVVAGRLWPEIKATGDACRKRYSQAKDRFYAEMQADFERQAQEAEDEKLKQEVAQKLQEFDDGWHQVAAAIKDKEEDYISYIAAQVFDISIIVNALAKEWGIDVDKVLFDSRGEAQR